MKSPLGKIIGIAALALLFVVTLLILTAPKNPQAIFRVVDASGKPIAGALIDPRGLRTKPGPYSSGWYTWTGQYYKVPPKPATTDRDGVATIDYPFYVRDKLETGTLCLEVSHADYVTQQPERVVSTTLPHGAPWRTLLTDWLNRLSHQTLVARPDPIILQKGATLDITISNAPPPNTGKFLPQVSKLYTDPTNWTQVTPGNIRSPQIEPGPHTVAIAFVQTNGVTLFSDVVEINAVKNQTNDLTLVLRPGATVHGQLDTTVPRPIKHGRVVANLWPLGIKPSDEPPQWHVWTNINADGTFTLASFPPGELEFAALCDGFISTNGPGKSKLRHPQQHLLAHRDQTITIGMEPTAILQVTLHDDQGNAVSNATVATWPNLHWGDWGAVIFANDCYNTSDLLLGRDYLRSWYTNHPKDFQATSDAKGVAILSNLPPTTDLLDVNHDHLALPVTTNGWAGGKTRAVTFNLTTRQTNYLSLRLVPKEQSVISHY